MTTTWTLQITRAKTLEGLKMGERKTVWTDTNTNRNANMWAPEIHYFDSIRYIYYTAGGSNPFKSYSHLVTLTNTWGIDNSIARFNSWGNFFVWSGMSNNLQSLCIAQLTSPGKIGTTKVLSTPTQSWEKNGAPVMEGPAANYYGGKTYLTYSASYRWTAQYSLGLLTWNGSGDPSLSASWAKSGPVFTSANSNYGPGHNGFFTSPDGKEIWNVYHATANSAGACDGNRYTIAQKANFNSNSTPNFGTPGKLGTTITGPSGEYRISRRT
ncbi:hypothetical protein E8E12_005637 [Didymella heteroderae]|uniref:Hydrolase n=1 Tax=Didymella heteroderae TaxID=1769908 RepID=A0A9P4WLX7_9PLEO|nr:hypothetical protein E8E12_005637 [Didymella heteroderae]